MGAAGFHKGVAPITLAVKSTDIPMEEWGAVLKKAIPKGYVGTSPQIIKTLDGEWLVMSNGSAHFVAFGRSPGELIWLY